MDSDDVGVFVRYDVREGESVAQVLYPTMFRGETWTELIRGLHAHPVGVLAQGTDPHAPECALEVLLAMLLRMAR